MIQWGFDDWDTVKHGDFANMAVSWGYDGNLTINIFVIPSGIYEKMQLEWYSRFKQKK